MTAPNFSTGYPMTPQTFRSGMKKLSQLGPQISGGGVPPASPTPTSPGPFPQGTGLPNTKTPTGQVYAGGFPFQTGGGGPSGWGDAPKFDPSGFTPSYNSGAMPVNMQGQESRGGIPGVSGTNTNANLGGLGAPGGGATGGQGTTFTGQPGGNLINAQFNPTPGLRTLGAQGATDQAKTNYSNYQFQPFNAQGPMNDTAARNAVTGANDKTQSMSSMGYNPVAGTDLTGARSYLAQAGANLGPSSAASGLVGPGASGSFGYNGDTGAVRGQTQGQLNKMLNTNPDRGTLAKNTFQRLIDDTNPAYEQEMRQVNQKNAAMGRGGSGMSTQDLGTVAQRRQEQLIRRAAELSDNAAGLSLQDEQDKLNAARGVTTDFGGLDTAAGSLNLGYQQANNAERGNAFDRARALGNDTFGRSMDLSNAEMRFGQIGRDDALTERDAQRTSYLDRNNVLGEQASGLRNMGSDLYGMDSDAWNRGVSERDKGINYDQNMFNNRRNVFGDMATDEQRLTGNDRADRTELRGERDYQYGLSRDATNDAVNQRMMEEQLLNSRFARGQGLFGAGYSQNPTGVYGQQADSFGQDAASSYGAMGDLFGSSVLNKRRPNAQASYNGSF